MSIIPNVLFQADCLDLFERMNDRSVALVYLDPLWEELSTNISDKDFNNYLEFLSKVIQQSHRILNDTGNIYFHLLPSFSNYIRIILDQIFGRGNFRNEFILPRKSGNRTYKQNHETIVLYGKSENSIYNPPTKLVSVKELGYETSDEGGAFRLISLISPVYRLNYVYELNGILPPTGKSWKYSREKMEDLNSQGLIHFTRESGLPNLKKYTDNNHIEIEIDNIWDDLLPRLTSAENYNYPAQKPVSVIERIIRSGSNELDTIFDPFCGTGTTLVSAEKLNRKWIGCDISSSAIETTKRRLYQFSKNDPISYLFLNEIELKNVLPVSVGYNSIFTGMEYATRIIFELNKNVIFEETKNFEFKEILSNNPVDVIKNTADNYAVAFLNSEGGKLFWGIRDDKAIVGVKVDQSQRDRIRKEVINKLNDIQPKLSPSDYSINFYQVSENEISIQDLFIIELTVPKPRNQNYLYCTGGNEIWIKTDSGKRIMTPIQIQEETIKRFLAKLVTNNKSSDH